ncbi:TIGR02710 family CRISPR-associated protein [Oxynema sp. CENA135]|uniref:TIGR02710 family CRISPR-associated CARF protein n=1 Tax=Oxynema sp. CENA135 TaxID=984206 RepID=UPI00190BE977|nr:TIGR02710 family CRISPR-associated CARF protein [Oxynema sp. CENA135]MBK4730297.1 TIGR02710 family CRISPR-associated protein [Oxynema sp. CENA135]
MTIQTILLITVGGSPEPILTAIKELEPNRVVFICSDDTEDSKGSKDQIIGQDKPCIIRKGDEVEKRDNIPTQLQMGDRFNPDRDLVLLSNPDDLSESYRAIAAKIREIQQELPNSEILADYTCGTKTMSAALAMVGLDYRLSLYVTTSIRRNLVRVESGEITEKTIASPILVERTIEQFLPLFLQQYNYPAAIAELKNSLKMELPSPLKRRIRTLYECCMGFDAWDRFDHVQAWKFLSVHMKYPSIQPLVLFLKRVMGSREGIAHAANDDFQAPEKINGHGYEIVEDLLLNAQRRASLERYDDAVARLYRALELLEQVRLWQGYQIKTGDLDLEKIPESLHEKYSVMRSPVSQAIQIGLTKSYELLGELSDPLGEIYLQQKSKILDSLKLRNYSILAHGLQPVSQDEYDQFARIVIPFIEDGIIASIPKSKSQPIQFPTALNI